MKNNKIQNKKINGFWQFAIFPTQLTSGETIWMQKYFVGGSRFGITNRFSCGHRRFETKYSKDSV